MTDYMQAVKTGRAMAHELGYTATSLKKVLGLVQDDEVAPRDLYGYLNVKCRELEQYTDELQSITDAIGRSIGEL